MAQVSEYGSTELTEVRELWHPGSPGDTGKRWFVLQRRQRNADVCRIISDRGFGGLFHAGRERQHDCAHADSGAGGIGVGGGGWGDDVA